MSDDSMSLEELTAALEKLREVGVTMVVVQPVEFRVLLFVNREGEPCARLQRTDVKVVEDQTGNVVTIAQLLLQVAETYEKAVELNEALLADPNTASAGEHLSKVAASIARLEALVGGACE